MGIGVPIQPPIWVGSFNPLAPPGASHDSRGAAGDGRKKKAASLFFCCSADAGFPTRLGSLDLLRESRAKFVTLLTVEGAKSKVGRATLL